MKYLILWLQQMIDQIPPALRKVKIQDFAWVLLEGLRWLYESLVVFMTQTREEIGKNGQVMVLEKLLNDAFDNSLRRIFIGDYVAIDSQALYLISEAQVNPPLYLLSAIPPNYSIPLLLSSELEGSVNFIVWIPLALQGLLNLTLLSGILNKYKYAGMRYIIQYY